MNEVEGEKTHNGILYQFELTLALKMLFYPHASATLIILCGKKSMKRAL